MIDQILHMVGWIQDGSSLASLLGYLLNVMCSALNVKFLF